MNTLLDEITAAARTLPAEDRAKLADVMVQSLDGETLTDIDRMWLDEAKRRRDEVRRGDVATINGEDALRRVREMLS